MFVRVGNECINLNCVERITLPDGEITKDSVCILHFASGGKKQVDTETGQKILRILPNPFTNVMAMRALAIEPELWR